MQRYEKYFIRFHSSIPKTFFLCFATSRIIPIFAMTILTNDNCNNMKNKLLLFLTLLFFVVSASAQGYCSSVLWNATLDSTTCHSTR